MNSGENSKAILWIESIILSLVSCKIFFKFVTLAFLLAFSWFQEYSSHILYSLPVLTIMSHSVFKALHLLSWTLRDHSR